MVAGNRVFQAAVFAAQLLTSLGRGARLITVHCTEVRFAGFLSGGLTIMAVMNPPEKKLEKHTCVQWAADKMNFEEMIDPLQ